MTTAMVGAAHPPRRGPAAAARRGPLPRRPRPRRARASRSSAAPTPTPASPAIDVDDALDVDGLVAIYTHEDLPDKLQAPLPLLIPHPALTHARTQYVLANGEVNHVGEAIVVVVARDRYAAEDAVERIRVDYELLPAVVGLEAAVTADARRARPRSPTTSPPR